MAISLTILQALTFGLGLAIAYAITSRKSGFLWSSVAFIVGFVLAWPLGVMGWAFAFANESPYDAIVAGMPRSFFFALAGPIAGIYFARKINNAKEAASDA